MVHPSLTTRASTRDRLQASNNALVYLRTINRLVGPCNADFDTAFAFATSGGGRRGPSQRQRSGRQDSPEHEGDVDAISSEYATSGSVWAKAEDFWHVVGWAFNCSVVHANRWARWKLWLGFMLDVLEDDWKERERRSRGGGDSDEILKASLIAAYLPSELSRYGGKRRVVRAIFADGSVKSLNEFKEVFRNETRERGSGVKRKRGPQVNVDEENYGDYVDSEDDEGLMIGLGRATASPDHDETASAERVESGTDESVTHGDLESLLLRQRLLSLVGAETSQVSRHG